MRDWDEQFDMVIVGAGPAGAMAARQCATRGASVLLVDHATFPRSKVCGCCINQSSLATLDRVGLGELTKHLGAPAYDGIRLFQRHRRAFLRLPAGVSLSRAAFDNALVEAAVEAGVVFRSGHHAKLGGIVKRGRIVELRRADCQSPSHDVRSVRAGLVIAADGLGGHLLDREREMGVHVSRTSRMGIGGVALSSAPSFYEPGVIHMACGRRGYVGLVRLEDGTLDVASAMDAAFIKEQGGPGGAVSAILAECDMPTLPNASYIAWRGTPLLTRRRASVAGERLFVIGDAAGYVEPFTGEGIAWALQGGAAVAPIAVDAVNQFKLSHAKQWSRAHARLIGRKQRVCRMVARTLRNPVLTTAMMRVLNIMPSAATLIVAHINAHGNDPTYDAGGRVGHEVAPPGVHA